MIGYMILGIIMVLIVIIAIRTVTFKRKYIPSLEWEGLNVDGKRIASKLSAAIQIPTVSHMECSLTDYTQLTVFHELLEKLYPRVHSELEKVVINDYSLVYKYKGKNSEKKPTLLMAHMDVVPIAEGTEADWRHDPFSGAIEDGFVWGRGALDTKVTLLSALEAVELLLEKSYQPERDIYLAFGHDEEIQGTQGAKKIAEYFESLGIEFEFILDEGGIVTTDSIKGIDEPIAIIGIAEKGYADIEMTVKGTGGHASMPPQSTALGQMSRAVVNIEKHQLPLKMSEPVNKFFKQVGPSMGGVNKVILANLWLFKPLFVRIFAKTATGNALLRTTTAVTMSEASNASNVLPQKAKTTANFRIAPGDSMALVEAHIKEVTKGIEVTTKILLGNEPTGVASTTSQGYRLIEQVASHVFKGAIIAPYLVMAATDSKNFEHLAEDVYRFAPLMVNSEELATIHNTNECISIDNLVRCVSFYTYLIKKL